MKYFSSSLSIAALVTAALLFVSCKSTADNKEETIEIVKYGKPNAQIVIPDKAFPVVEYAAEELQYHIEKATGAKLDIVTENKVGESAAHHIYLGDCKATRKAGIKFIEPATPGEKYRQKWRVQHLIRTVGNDLFMAGNDNGYKVGNRYQMTYHGTLFAVYDFLKTQMGVKWLWPGELGEVIPKNKNLSVGKLDISGKEFFAEARFCVPSTSRSGSGLHWQSKKNFEKYVEARDKWLLRQHMNVCNEITYTYGHYFYNAGYVKRFLKKRPDFFQLLPDGKRGYIPGMSGHKISMCVSNPDLWKQEIKDWLGYLNKYPLAKRGGKVGGGMGWMVNACENDTAAGCTCKACRAWDKDPAFAKHDYWNGKKYITDGSLVSRYQAAIPDSHGNPAPSLSDRYARFYLELQKKAKKHDPNAVVFGYAYQNYKDVPKKAKLNDNIVICTVPWGTFPLSDEKIESEKKRWEGWAATGARMKLRPNTLSSMSIYPVDITEEFAELFSHHAKHGMVATAFDSLTGQWGVQAPYWYVFSNLHQNPDMPVKKILDEFYSGFGKAEDAVRNYFAYFKQVCENAKHNPPASEDIRRWAQQKAEGYGWFGIRDNALINGTLVFTPEVLAKAKSHIEKAEIAAKGDGTVEKRVDFLAKGLKYITLATDLYRKRLALLKNKNDLKAFDEYAIAVEALMNYRKNVVEAEMIANPVLHYEKATGLRIDHSLKASTTCDLSMIWGNYFENRKYGSKTREFKDFEEKTGSYDLDEGWLFSPAPDEKGVENGWQTVSFDDSKWSPIGVDSHWKDQPWGKKWKEEHEDNDYQGIGWYRLNFKLPENMKEKGKNISLFFGSVDLNCKVWLNGKLVCDRKDGNWNKPFMVDITDTVKCEGQNVLSVRVDHVAGAGGIWKKVWLVASDKLEPLR